MTGPVTWYGGKAQMSHLLLPHFPRAQMYCEPFFGGGGMFFGIPMGMYPKEVVNDINKSVVTFFRALRDKPDELADLCELSPTARDEFIDCFPISDNELEEARRFFVRMRQGFSGQGNPHAGNWRRKPGNGGGWPPNTNLAKILQFRAYAARLQRVMVDNIDGVEFVNKWGYGDTFLYCDPPYLHTNRVSKNNYSHEMGEWKHHELAHALHEAVKRGCRVAVSGYESYLYDRQLFKGWRKKSFEVALHANREQEGKRRTEVLWMSYPEERREHQGSLL